MSDQLALRMENFQDRAISPLMEMGAYEALWDQPGASFKRLAEMFQQRPGAVPSDFVRHDKANEYAEKAIEILSKSEISSFGIRVHGSGEYPIKLRDAKYPIELLYFQGWWDLVETPSIAIVGTREPSDKGVEITRKLTEGLVKMGFTIVSGLAKGIDTVAHSTALKLGGETIGVIGTPLSRCYPKQNCNLQKKLANDHLIVSQVPICKYEKRGPRQNRFFFPERNITMSALTEATIIVEAGETSGTLTQARAAFHQGRKLFILDSCFQNKSLTWPTTYEKRGGVRVKNLEEIISHLG